MNNTISDANLANWLEAAGRYFENRDTGGEDMAHWSNVFSAENCREAANRIRLSAQQREPVVRVKKLKWSKDSLKCSYPARYKATTPGDFGDYTVAGDEKENEWRWFRNGFFVRGHYLHNPMTLDEAKSAAQADYEQRIMAAIEVAPQSGRQPLPGQKQISETGKELPENAEQPMNNADVSVGELAGFFVTEFPHLLTMSTQIEVARALLTRFRIERLDRLEGGRK